VDGGKVGGRVGVKLVLSWWSKLRSEDCEMWFSNLASESSVAGDWRATDPPRKGR
jgi:hypothetical protein